MATFGWSAVGLFAPITGQIEPIRLGETQRANRNGIRLHADAATLKRLREDYPSHDFILDCDEGKELFKSVRYADALEMRLEEALRKRITEEYGSDYVRFPHPFDGLIGPISATQETENSGRNNANRQSTTSKYRENRGVFLDKSRRGRENSASDKDADGGSPGGGRSVESPAPGSAPTTDPEQAPGGFTRRPLLHCASGAIGRIGIIIT